MIYLDYAASTPLLPSALKAFEKALAEDYANPASAHKLGKKINKKVEQCRKRFLHEVQGERDFDFYFTSSATESNNWVIQGCARDGAMWVGYSPADHPSVTVPCKKLFDQNVLFSHLETGLLDISSLELYLENPQRGLVVISHLNNHSGVITDVAEVARKIKKWSSKIHIHVDGAQSFLKVPLDLSKTPIDSYTISAHKMGGPKGAGGLFLRKSLSLEPLLLGGGQEHGKRSSTVNAPAILSWTAALNEISDHREETSDQQVSIQNKLLSGLRELPDVEILFDVPSCSHIIALLTKGLSSDIVMRHLEMKEIYLSSSSACSSRSKGESPVLAALNVPASRHKEYLRLSFGCNTNESQVVDFLKAFKDVLTDLQKIKGRH